MAQSGGGLTEGKVTYISSQNIYVRFNTTEGLKDGDTLFTGNAQSLLPALKILSLSSTSCVCVPLENGKFTVSQPILSNRIKKSEKQTEIAASIPAAKNNDSLRVPDTSNVLEKAKKIEKKRKQLIRGSVNASSYSDLSNMTQDLQRMRYRLSLTMTNIHNSRFSAETYMSYNTTNQVWTATQNKMFDGLKIYNLAVKYEFSDNFMLWAGRRFNQRISNMGAIDGLQGEYKHKALTYGLILGYRPDLINYSFNANLFQAGAYVSHDYQHGKNFVQNTLAFAEQQNSGKTDRRFFYYQLTSSLFKGMFFFGSADIDIYKNVGDTISNSPKLTNLYLSFRYNLSSQLGLSLAYSERQNIIYYESYKNIIDQLLQAESTKGFLFNANYRPGKKITFGLNSGYHLQNSDINPSWNANTYITYNDIPLIKAAATFSYTALESSYMSGKIYSLGLSRDIIPGKLNLDIVYRMIDYSYKPKNIAEIQNIAEVNFDIKLYKKLSMGLNYEGISIGKDLHNRIYIQLSQRF